MPTTTQRPTAAQRTKPAQAPFSTAAARLIEHIQAEARAQLLADLSAKDAIIVLHGFDADTKRVYTDSESIEVNDAAGNCINLYRLRTEPNEWKGRACMRGHWHPARWYGRQTMVDSGKTKWDRQFAPHICDDFGNLVEVAA